MIKIIRGLAVVGAVLIAVVPAIAGEGANSSKTAATNAIWRGILDVGEPENRRAVLLQEFKDVVRTYPDSEHVEIACESASILHTMVQQDQEHKKLTDEQYRELAPTSSWCGGRRKSSSARSSCGRHSQPSRYTVELPFKPLTHILFRPLRIHNTCTLYFALSLCSACSWQVRHTVLNLWR